MDSRKRGTMITLWKDGWKESGSGDGKDSGWWMTSVMEALR